MIWKEKGERIRRLSAVAFALMISAGALLLAQGISVEPLGTAILGG